MRVLVVSAWEPWRLTDGTVWILHHHLRHLAERHELTVLAAGAPRAESAVPDEVGTLPEQVRVRWFGTARHPAVDYVVRRLQSEGSGEPAQVHWVERPALLSALDEELRAQRPDVVHSFGWGTARLWQRTGDVPTVHFACDSWDLSYGVRRLPGWRRVADAGQHAKVRRHEATHYPRLDGVMVVAPPDAEHLQRIAPGARVHVVRNGVDAGPEPVPPPDAPVLGFHGSFEATHNIDAARVLVRDVLPRVRSRVPGARVLLVGRNPSPEVRALVGADVELRADVDDVRRQLDHMTVYVAPLVSGSGLKNKVLEAMAAGRPVVTTPLGSAGIDAGPGLVEVPTGDADAAAAAAAELLLDRTALEREGTAARERVTREFTWAASAAAVEAVWHAAGTQPAGARPAGTQ